jgi:hypothetical protein
MSYLFLARLQFGLTAGFHFLFRIGPILWHLCRYPAALWNILQDSTRHVSGMGPTPVRSSSGECRSGSFPNLRGENIETFFLARSIP